MKTKKELLELANDLGAVMSRNPEESALLEELENSKLLLRCSEIPCHELTLNPSYVFVSNNARGKMIAGKYPLFTVCGGRMASTYPFSPSDY